MKRRRVQTAGEILTDVIDTIVANVPDASMRGAVDQQVTQNLLTTIQEQHDKVVAVLLERLKTLSEDLPRLGGLGDLAAPVDGKRTQPAVQPVIDSLSPLHRIQ